MESKINYYYYYDYNGSSSTLQIKDRMSPLRSKQDQPKMRKVQVVYYLSRNGQLEHPHFMEVSPTNHHLRLKDVMERLTALRGRDMPALYSWSCKRSYKHGYVWNDLAENDVIYPTQGAEYVLKGSELLQGCTEKLEALQIKASDFHSQHTQSRVLKAEHEEEDENSSYSFSTNTPPSRCSVGISTDDIHLMSTSSSYSDKPMQPARNSVLLQLIACGSSTIGLKNRCGQRPKQLTAEIRDQRQVAVALRKSPVTKEEEEDVAMIKCMSENPRFGGFQTESKEYFSGSIIEGVAAEASRLKRSNSFNEERSRKHTELEEEEVKTGKCIPRKNK